jgi:hypothetical protein
VAFKKRIKEVIKKAEEEFKMEYVPLWERDAERRGEKIGIEKGIKITAKNLLKNYRLIVDCGLIFPPIYGI